MALPARTSTQLVLPPIPTVCGPGVGMLPRTPQNVIRMAESRDTAQESATSTASAGFLHDRSAHDDSVDLPAPLAHPINDRESWGSPDRSRRSARTCGQAIVVLGCRLRFRPQAPEAAQTEQLVSRLDGAASRRAGQAVATFFDRPVALRETVLIVTSGGRAWDGVVEADALAEAMVAAGVPPRQLVRERCSHSTRENARFTASLLERRGIEAIDLVTCAFHMRRAQLLFEREGFLVRTVPAHPPSPSSPSTIHYLTRLYQSGREWAATMLDRRFAQRDPIR